MATVTEERVDVRGIAGNIHTVILRPRGARSGGPVVVGWSDIFQLTPPHLRLMKRLASRGYTVVLPELYGRFEPAGSALDFDRDRQRALDDAARVELTWIDEDRRAILDHAATLGGPIGACGFCFGGHLAFRAATEPEVKATACFYATGVHSDTVGAAQSTADTLARAGQIRGELLLVWGVNDPHIPAAGRSKIHRALDEAGVRHEFRLHDAEHAFMRDEGPRFDPAATDQAFEAMIALFTRAL